MRKIDTDLILDNEEKLELQRFAEYMRAQYPATPWTVDAAANSALHEGIRLFRHERRAREAQAESSAGPAKARA